MFWIDLLLFASGVVVAIISGAFLLNAAISLGCAFPLLKILPKAYSDLGNLFDLAGVKKYFTTVLVLCGIVSVLILIAIVIFAPSAMKIGFFIYFAFSLFSAIKGSGLNAGNIADFVRILGKHTRPGKEYEAGLFLDELPLEILSAVNAM